jgi:hypothetical protein
MSGHDEAITPVGGGAGHPGLLRKLMAAIRPELRADVWSFDPADPMFGGPLCHVPGCRRPARSRGFCTGHHARWRQLGNPIRTPSPPRQSPDSLVRYWPAAKHRAVATASTAMDCAAHISACGDGRNGQNSHGGWFRFPRLSTSRRRAAQSRAVAYGRSRDGRFAVRMAAAGSTTAALTSPTTSSDFLTMTMACLPTNTSISVVFPSV